MNDGLVYIYNRNIFGVWSWTTISSMENNIKQKLYERELDWKQSLLNNVPVFFGFIVWGSIVFLGTIYFRDMFINEQAQTLVVVVWLVVALSLSRTLIPNSVNTYYIEEVR